MKNDLALRRMLIEGDVLIFDRGFRDVIGHIKHEYKLETMMPHLLGNDKRQFSAKEANESRLCTKLRWVVEVVNGVLKNCFRALDNRVQNKSLTHYLDDIRIAGALINKFHKRYVSDQLCSKEMAEIMGKRVNTANDLMTKVKTTYSKIQKDFKPINSKDDLNDFPSLSLDVLVHKIAFGTYQMRNSLSYLAEHFNENGGKFEASVYYDIKSSLKIITARIQSRHSSSKNPNNKYKVYVSYAPKNQSVENSSDGSELIKGSFHLLFIFFLAIHIIISYHRLVL